MRIEFARDEINSDFYFLFIFTEEGIEVHNFSFQAKESSFFVLLFSFFFASSTPRPGSFRSNRAPHVSRSRHALDDGAVAADARKSSGAGVSRDDVAATLASFASDDDKDSLLSAGAFLSSPAARRLQQLFLDLAVQ